MEHGRKQSMTQDEIRAFIANKTNEGLSLTAIQDALAAEGVKMRYMELRMLAAEIESVLQKKADEKAAAEVKPEEPQTQKNEPDTAAADPGTESAPASAAASAPAPGLRGQTSVTISPIQRPGYLACGTVTFGSGATAEWFLDQTGRLALDNATGQPDQEDIREFQLELRKVLGA